MNSFEVVVRKPSRSLRRRRGRDLYAEHVARRELEVVLRALAKRTPLGPVNHG